MVVERGGVVSGVVAAAVVVGGGKATVVVVVVEVGIVTLVIGVTATVVLLG